VACSRVNVTFTFTLMHLQVQAEMYGAFFNVLHSLMLWH